MVLYITIELSLKIGAIPKDEMCIKFGGDKGCGSFNANDEHGASQLHKKDTMNTRMICLLRKR